MAKLILNPTAYSRRDIPLRGEAVSIGRDPTNDVVLSDAMVSRRHAIIQRLGMRYVLRDCNSSNGSLVNGHLVVERPLRDGDVVAIGAMRLLFRDDAVAEDSSGKILRHPSAQRMSCPSCGAECRPQDTFCPECGEAVSRDRQIVSVERCGRCGRQILGPSRFCPSCGVRLGHATGEPLGGLDEMPWATVLREAPAPSSPSLSLPLDAPLAPPALRLLAALVDATILGVAEAVLLTPVVLYWTSRPAPEAGVSFLPVLLSVVTAFGAMVLAGAYPFLFVAFRGGTPGKQLLGLRVVTTAGRAPVGPWISFVRLVGSVVSVAGLGLGLLPILLGQDSLHDFISGTRVVRATGQR